jgi:hypothetical protein
VTGSATLAPHGAVARLVPVVTHTAVTRMPLIVVMGYVVATFFLFLTWPIDWPIYQASDWRLLILYVSLCFAVITVAMLAGSRGEAQLAAPLPGINVLLLAGAGAALALLQPSCFAYTGHGPSYMLEALQDQGAAYHRMQVALFYGEGTRTLIVAARVLAGPVTYAVLPLGIIHWRRIGWIGRIAVLVTVLCSVVFSIMRGTDKEIADLLVIGTAALAVAYGRSLALARQGEKVGRRYWFPATLLVLSLILAQGLFTERKDQRLGGFAKRVYVCANNSRICADLDNRAINWLPLRERFGLSEFILSTCSSYFGLNLALHKPFESALGVGHSPAALSVYETATGDMGPHMRTYTYRNGDDQWSEDYYWSTLITWIANDVGFAGAVAVVGLLGFAWGVWWREAAAGTSDPAAILFVQATTMIFYLPANNQVFASYEGYSIFFAWLGIWVWHRTHRRLFAALPLQPAACPA